MKQGDLARVIEDDGKIVFRKQDGDIPLPVEIVDQRHGILGFFERHARGRFIQQQQRWLAGKRDGKFQLLLVALGEGAGNVSPLFQQAA